ncbi:NADH-quinone oxidoreductase subunit C [bacterium]|nr:NADH-quinone oxidoreductase subunit C [bacterium]
MPLEPATLLETASAAVKAIGADALLDGIVFRGEVTLVIERDYIVRIIEALRRDPALSFSMLVDITAIDYLEVGREPRFDVVYALVSLEHRHRIRLRAPVPENDCHIQTIVPLWRGADFLEREVFDMFGIAFDGHPDLRRIIMPDNWEGHPLRKDFPLGGATSFYYKQDTDEYAGEPADLVPRIRVQDSDV